MSPRAAILLCLLTLAPVARAADPIVPAADGLTGKVFAGYQGWFNPGPAEPGGKPRWGHYGTGGTFEPGHCVIDLWPDTAGFDADELVPTAFRHADGRVAHVFSSANPKTVDRHFAWMKQYGIDGAFVQRFAGVVARPPGREFVDRVMANCRAGAAAHGRAWAVMYDLSGLKKGQIEGVVMPDWRRLTTELKVRDDATYLRHRGRPLVAVWGVGFNDGRDYTLDECRALVRFLKEDGNSVMLGVPYYWRELRNDAAKDPALHEVVRMADVVSPWAVGRFGKPEDALKRGQQTVAPDIKWCDERKLDYLPVAFPGFSWHNLQQTRGKEAATDAIPRQGGQFLWAQGVAARRAGATALYVAMFDEVDEGTAVFKVTNDPPVGASPFARPGGTGSDHYLWLTGRLGEVLRGRIPAGETMPLRGG